MTNSVIRSNREAIAPICSGKPPLENQAPDGSCQHSFEETTQQVNNEYQRGYKAITVKLFI
jgi:hypothetical protein